jgi:hypothetical protein
MPTKREEYGLGSRETTRLLSEGVGHVRDSEEIALTTGEMMREQRAVLESVRGNVDEMKGISVSAAESIRQLELKTTRRKICLWAAVLALFVSNVVILMQMWNNGGKIFSREGITIPKPPENPEHSKGKLKFLT